MNFMACRLTYALSSPYPELTGVTGGFQDIRDIFRRGTFLATATSSLRMVGRIHRCLYFS
jgi:hypothetical protein